MKQIKAEECRKIISNQEFIFKGIFEEISLILTASQFVEDVKKRMKLPFTF